MKNRLMLSVLFSMALLSMPQTAAAYLDPGTGSMLLQGLIALIAGILTTAGIYWRAAKDFFIRILRRKTDVKSDQSGGL